MASRGLLYIVATPIGNLADMSPRAVKVLSEVDLIAAEDTRHSRPLLAHFGIRTPTLAVHEHNEREVISEVLERLDEGAAVALISDAGTPLVSDPGYLLVRQAHSRGIPVSPVPGPNAAVCALSAAGLPTDRFVFEGYPPRTQAKRRAVLQRLKAEGRTLIFYESNHRIVKTLQDMSDIFGEERQATFAREITKLHETVISSSLGALCEWVSADPYQAKGEIVVLVQGVQGEACETAVKAERVLKILVDELSVKQAATLAAKITGEKRNLLYEKALQWRKRD